MEWIFKSNAIMQHIHMCFLLTINNDRKCWLILTIINNDLYTTYITINQQLIYLYLSKHPMSEVSSAPENRSTIWYFESNTINVGYEVTLNLLHNSIAWSTSTLANWILRYSFLIDNFSNIGSIIWHGLHHFALNFNIEYGFPFDFNWSNWDSVEITCDTHYNQHAKQHKELPLLTPY